MLKVSLKWGVASGAIMTVLLLISFFFFPENDPAYFSSAENYGYASMVASLAVIYLALNDKSLRTDTVVLTMWQRILIGCGVSLVAGLIFGFYNLIYTSYMNPEFMDVYYDYYISQLPVQSGPEFERMVAELEAQKSMFMAPVTQFSVMAATVVMIGIPMSIVLAFIHKLRAKA